MAEKKKLGLGDTDLNNRYVDFVDRELKKQGIDYDKLPKFHLKNQSS